MATITTKSPNDARCASFGPLVSFFFLRCFFVLTNALLYTGYILHNTRQDNNILGIWIRETRVGLEDSDDDDDGPKRHTSGVVWAIGVFSSFFFSLLY